MILTAYGGFLMRRTLFTIGLIGVVTAVTITALTSYQNRQTAVVTPEAKPVTVAVNRGDVAQTVTAPGQLVGVQERMLGVDVNGRLLELTVRPGSIVQAGDVIARLDATPYETARPTAPSITQITGPIRLTTSPVQPFDTAR